MRGGAPSLVDRCILSGPISACCLGGLSFLPRADSEINLRQKENSAVPRFLFYWDVWRGGPCLGLAIVRCGPDDAAAKRAILVYGYTTTV